MTELLRSGTQRVPGLQRAVGGSRSPASGSLLLTTAAYQWSASVRATISAASRESVSTAAIRRSVASARSRRRASSVRQERNAPMMCAAICRLLIQRQYDIGDEIVAGAVKAVELGVVRLRERADQRTHAVGISHGKRRMRGDARTRSSIAGSGITACNASHLSMTSGSSA